MKIVGITLVTALVGFVTGMALGLYDPIETEITISGDFGIVGDDGESFLESTFPIVTE